MFSKLFSNSKAFLLVALTMAICMICTNTVQAQSNRALLLRTANGSTFNYGKQAILTTTDASAHTIATITAGANETGIIEAQVVGFDSTGGDAVTGSLIIRYKKVGGTLTLGSPVVDAAIVTDAGLNSATFAFAASSNNINLNVTGDTSTTVKWVANIRVTAKSQ
jgi:hypothetical protein